MIKRKRDYSRVVFSLVFLFPFSLDAMKLKKKKSHLECNGTVPWAKKQPREVYYPLFSCQKINHNLVKKVQNKKPAGKMFFFYEEHPGLSMPAFPKPTEYSQAFRSLKRSLFLIKMRRRFLGGGRIRRLPSIATILNNTPQGLCEICKEERSIIEFCKK